MDERDFSSEGYDFGFNGKEKDDEVKGSGEHYDYGYRCYDSRLGKFISVDPLFRKYPYYSGYQFAGNKPIWKIDLDGLEDANPPFAVMGTLRFTPSGNKMKVNYGVGFQVPLNNTTTVNLNVNNFQQNNRTMFNGFISTSVVPGGLTAGGSISTNGEVKGFINFSGPSTFEAPDLAEMSPDANNPVGFTLSPPPQNLEEYTQEKFDECQEECENISINGPEEAKITTEDGGLKINNDQATSDTEMAEKTAKQIDESVKNSAATATPTRVMGPTSTQENSEGNIPSEIPKNYEEFKRVFLSMPLPKK